MREQLRQSFVLATPAARWRSSRSCWRSASSLSLSAGAMPIRLLGVSAQGNAVAHRGHRTGRIRRQAP